MKKVLLVFVLAAIIATGSAFADHPGGLGIGILWGGINHWEGHGFNHHVALSLKVPSVPIYWGISFGMYGHYTHIGVQGDYYLIDDKLISTLHWFLGIGGYVGLGLGDEADVNFGARLPIGLSWQPVKPLEIFLNIAPSIGASIWTHGDGGVHFPNGGINFEIGIRLWI